MRHRTLQLQASTRWDSWVLPKPPPTTSAHKPAAHTDQCPQHGTCLAMPDVARERRPALPRFSCGKDCQVGVDTWARMPGSPSASRSFPALPAKSRESQTTMEIPPLPGPRAAWPTSSSATSMQRGLLITKLERPAKGWLPHVPALRSFHNSPPDKHQTFGT